VEGAMVVVGTAGVLGVGLGVAKDLKAEPRVGVGKGVV
jgi:hypothetical protein